MFWLWAAAGTGVCVILTLTIKLLLIRKAAQEIEMGFQNRLEAETNTLIDISSRDRRMRSLAASVNVQLRKLRSQRLRWARGDLELKDAVAGISHDLRTPLTAICGYLDLLEQESLPEPAARYLAQIQNRTEALKELTEELFRYSVAASSRPLFPVPLDLRSALEENLLSFYGAMEGRGITPQIRLPEGRLERCLDPSALGRVFSNIIGNALKYSGGDLTIEMEETGVTVFSNTAKNLTPVTAGRLFDRFYTVQTGSTSTGLGLSIAKLLTERMGGTIAADYRDGKLSITLCFPPEAMSAT